MPKPARAGPVTGADTDTRTAILQAAERQLRRFGPEKLTVLDIAREAGMSHPNLYRFFGSKGDILDAVVAGWLASVEAPLAAIAHGSGSAAERLREFIMEQFRIKSRKVLDDSEMFRCYGSMINATARAAIDRHLEILMGMLVEIVADGIARGEFAAGLDPKEAAATLREATIAFHSPVLLPAVLERGDAEGRLARVVDLLIAGLKH